MRVALDTNILAYAEGVGDAERCRQATELVASLPTDATILPAQTLGELSRVLTSKRRLPASQARAAVFAWADSFEVMDSSWPAFQSAFDLTVDHQLPMWDALILAVAAEAQCRMLLSEDFQDGFVWRGVMVVNPFSINPSPLLASFLDAKAHSGENRGI